MSTVNQLLAKASSTTSDEEAIACLKMARKKSVPGEAVFGHEDKPGPKDDYQAKYKNLVYQYNKDLNGAVGLAKYWREKHEKKVLESDSLKNMVFIFASISGVSVSALIFVLTWAMIG